MLYSSTEASTLVDDAPSLDANSYPPFKTVDTTVLQRISREMEALGDMEEERTPHRCFFWETTR